MNNQLPKIFGLMKVRNEQEIIKDTLDKWAPFCTGGIFIYDDVSTDKTVEICKNHPAVVEILQGSYWDPDREKAEHKNRQAVLSAAKSRHAGSDDWFVYFDADEHLYNFTDFSLFEKYEAIACRLYDFYITSEDVDKSYLERNMIGPEFRTIPFFFKNSPFLKYHLPDQRIVTMKPGIDIAVHGDIKHYGKGFSVEQWEKTCDYYIKFWPKYADKWRKRKGKAVHDGMSDFDNALIPWEKRAEGFSLEAQDYGK